MKFNPFIVALVLLDVGACTWEFFHGHHPKAFYWFFVAGINWTVLYL